MLQEERLRVAEAFCLNHASITDLSVESFSDWDITQFIWRRTIYVRNQIDAAGNSSQILLTLEFSPNESVIIAHSLI